LYAYVGSAQKSLEKRIERHLGRTKRKFWHIDYLLNDDSVEVLKVFYKNVGKSEECKVANKIGERCVPTKGFGSSDCKCQSHLFKVEDYQFLREFMLETLLI
jgi:Uri superfamily endonuclease